MESSVDSSKWLLCKKTLLHNYCGVVLVTFFSLPSILGEIWTIHSPPALFFFFLSFKWRLARAHWFYTLGQDQSTVAQQAEKTGPMFPDKLPVSGLVSPLRLCCVNGVCVFRCNLPPALLAEWLGSFTCHCGNSGVERTPNKSKHARLTLRRKFSLRYCRDSNSQPFNHESRLQYLLQLVSIAMHRRRKTWYRKISTDCCIG